MSLVPLRLEPLLGRVREVDGLEMQSSLGSDTLVDGESLLRLDLAVRLVLNDEPRYVLDDSSDRLNCSGRVLDDDSDLGARDAQAPEAFAVAVDEAGERLLNVLKLESQRVDKVELVVRALDTTSLVKRGGR